MAATCAGPPLANGLQPLSCLRCAHRKVRCDRVAPCKNCIKHNAACEFPQPKSEKRRRRKMVIASPPQTKLRSRTLSAGVESLSGSLQGRITDSPQRAQNPPRERADIAAGFPDSHLVVFGNQSRYFEGELWTKIGRELDAGSMFHHPYLEQEEKEERNHNEDKDRFTFNTGTGYRASGLPLGLSGERFSLKTPYPNPERFRQLWQIYLSNVHPVTMILHAPSASETLAEAVEGHGHASKETEALLFATMACALVSITDAACMRLLGEKRSVLLSMYLHGCERALARANFLISCNLGVLQAYTLYLVAIGPHVDPSEVWNLTGIAKRNAQRLGLHRKISTADVTPFEVEMRRRLWFQIVMQDTISAHNVGLHWPNPDCEMTAPSNVNDADLSPRMKDPPKNRVGPTDMIFVNLLYKVMDFMGQVNCGRRPWASLAAETRRSAVDQLYRAEREKAVADMEEELELEVLRYCDMLNPVHFYTVIMARLTLCKMRYKMLQSCQCGKNRIDCTEKDREEMFSAALKVLEYENKGSNQISIQGFLWHGHQHFAWSCLIHILEDLRTHPHEEQADKAWEQIRIFYDIRPDLYQGSQSRLGPLYSAINKMAVEAWQIRETQASESGQILASPAYITVLRQQKNSPKLAGEAEKSHHPSPVSVSQAAREQATNQGLLSMSCNFEQESACWPAWAGSTLPVSNLAANPPGNCVNLLDPIFDQEIFMSVGGHNSNRIYQPQILMPPLDQYTTGG